MNWDLVYDALWIVLYIFIAFLALIILFYIISQIAQGSRIIVSKPFNEAEPKPDGKTISNTNATSIDQYYYLPTASIIIKARAKVAVDRNITSTKVQNIRLIELDLENTVVIEPDIDTLLAIEYKPFLFGNDELRLTTDATGLLSTVSAETEDRIGAIVAQVADAPAQILGADRAFRLTESVEITPQTNTTTEIIFATNTFTILSEDLNTGSFKRHWTIQATGSSADQKGRLELTLMGDLPKMTSKTHFKQNGHDGVLTRPITKKTLQIRVSSPTQQNLIPLDSLQYDVLIPDHSRLIEIPIKRYPFVKNRSIPKFSHGLLVENFISKPSEFEGFIGIPIRIAKAIFSIPAELLNFKIMHLRQLNTLAAEQNKQNALQAATKNPGNDLAIADLQQQLATLQAQKDKGNTYTPDQPDTTHETKFGKKPPTDNDPIQILPLIPAGMRLTEGQAPPTGLGTPDTARQWQLNFNSWTDYNNHTLRTCTPAAAANMIICWTSNLPAGNLFVPSLDDVMEAYKDAGPNPPGTDSGCMIKDILSYWKNTFIGNHSIDNFKKITPGDKGQLKTAIFYYGGAMVGFQLPPGIEDNDLLIRWEVPTKAGKALAGVNGHTVAALGYDDNYIAVISWGIVRWVSWAFYKQYNDETWIALSQNDWTPGGALSPAPSGKDFTTLNNVMNTKKTTA